MPVNPEHEYYQCPVHQRWMAPVLTPYPHWACPVSGCDRRRAAKMRTRAEERIFERLAMDELAKG